MVQATGSIVGRKKIHGLSSSSLVQKRPKAKTLRPRRPIGKIGKSVIPPSMSFENLYHEKLRDRKFAIVYLTECIIDPDPKMFLVGLRDVILARGGMAQIADRAEVNRESLYKAVSKNGNPSISYLKRVLEALDISLKFV